MPGYALQQQNQDMVSLLSAYFRLLYNPTHAFADAVNMALAFPALRGFWPGSAVGSSGEMNDLSGNGLQLTNNSNAQFGNDGLAPYTDYDGTADYHSRADAAIFDILGTEAYIANPGLTMGGWFQFDRLATAEGLMGKFGAGTNQSYLLQKFGANSIGFRVSGDGTTVLTATSTGTVTTGTWYFIAGVYIPSTSLTIYINDDTTVNSTSIPASIFNSTASFIIGAYDGGAPPTQPLNGRVSLAFLCASAIPNIFISTFYQMTAPLFNVSI